ncbi:hypothetical protein EV363DRAFT_1178820, partial [Boletus edulis]
TSPPIPSPSHLAHFLAYAETHLSIQHASTYWHALNLQGIGWDILADMDNQVLAGIGISMGDIVHLKKGSVVWWNGPKAKRKWSDTVTSSGTERSKTEPQKKKVAYKKQYHAGGGNRFLGLAMEEGDADLNSDFDLYYKCNTQKQ